MYSIFGREQPLPSVEPAPPCLFNLSPAIRFRIYRYVVSTESDRPIRLNPQVFTRAVWPTDAFDSLAAALAPLQGALNASFALRAEGLAAFWQSRRVHVVFSPYVRPAVCPLATLYLQRYATLLATSPNITLELDCTRLGYGMHPAAAGLQPGLLSMEALVDGFAERILEQKHSLQSLTVLCRRYYGNRPAGPATDSTGEVPYVGPEVEQVAAQLGQLAGRVMSARFVGFSESFTTGILETLGGASDDSSSTVIQRHTPSDMYPLLPGHSAFVDRGPGLGICLSTHSALAPSICVKDTVMEDDARTISSVTETPDIQMTSASTSTSSSSLSIFSSTTSLALPLTPLKLNLPSITLSLDFDFCPRSAVSLPPLPSLSGIKRGSHNRTRKRPPLLTLMGLCSRRPGTFVAERLAAAGLAVGAVGSPLRLGDASDVCSPTASVVDIVNEKMVEKMDFYVEETVTGQDPGQPLTQKQHRQSWAGSMIGRDRQDRPQRKLQKRRHMEAPLVW